MDDVAAARVAAMLAEQEAGGGIEQADVWSSLDGDHRPSQPGGGA